MSAIPQKKLCWNCEGEVSFIQEDCPLCGVYLKGVPVGQSHWQSSSMITNINADANVQNAAHQSSASQPNGNNDLAPQADEKVISLLTPLIMLLGGTIFAVFGIMLALFANNNVFTLSWSAAYWYLYVLASIPMLIYGCISLQKLE